MSGYKARFLPQFDSPAAWNEILAPRAMGPQLTTDLRADFAVIGAGFAGVSAARRLHQLHPTAKIIVVDALRVAEGSAGRNSGFMIDLPHDLTSEDYAGEGAASDAAIMALNRQAIGFALDAVQDYGIDSNFAEPVGKVNGAATPAGDQHNIDYATHLAQLGEPYEKLDAQSMQAMTGSCHYRSGLFTPGSVMLQPAGYIRGMVDGLRRDGVKVFEQSAVQAFARRGADWLIKTALGSISTGRIILATNGHLESFGIAKGRLMQIFLYASMSKELNAQEMAAIGGVPRWGVTPADPMGTTVRRIDTGLGGNRIVTRTCAAMRLNMQTSSRDVARAAGVHQAKFDQRFPPISGLEMQYSWAGHLCLSRNGVSVTREVDQGVFSACVQNGLGTARGTLTGIAAADMACGVESDIARHFEAEDAPRRVLPQPFAQIGANAYLRFKEWRAGEE